MWLKSYSRDHPALYSSLPRMWQKRQTFAVKEAFSAQDLERVLDTSASWFLSTTWKGIPWRKWNSHWDFSRIVQSGYEKMNIWIRGLNSEGHFPSTTLPRNLFPTKAYTASIHWRICYVIHFHLLWRVWQNSFCMAFLKFFHAVSGSCPLSSLCSWLVCTLRASSPTSHFSFPLQRCRKGVRSMLCLAEVYEEEG